MKKKKKQDDKGTLIFLILLATLVLGVILGQYTTPLKKAQEEMQESYRIEKRICENVEVEVGKKLINKEEIKCNKVIIFGEEECLSEHYGHCDWWDETYGNESNAECYEGEYKIDYPCDASYCEFDDYTVVKDKKFSYIKENWQPILKLEEQCRDEVVEEIVAEVYVRKENLSKEFLEEYCEYFEVYEPIDPWKCFENYTVYVE